MLVVGSIVAAMILMNQLREKPLTGRLYRQPLGLLLIAGIALSLMPNANIADWSILTATLIVSFALGLIQGRYTPLTHHNGAWYLSGSLFAALVWLMSVPIRYSLNYCIGHFLDISSQVSGSSAFIFYFIFIGGLLLGRYSMLFLRYPALVKKIGQNEDKLSRINARG